VIEKTWASRNPTGRTATHDKTDGQRPTLHARLDEARRTSHGFGYGVGDDMDDLLVEHGIDD
jgi:hypothetical protein